MKRSPIKRYMGLKRSGFTRKPGKKTKAWNDKRAELKERFKRAGVTVCELAWKGCWRNNTLGFAHSLRRRNIITDEEIEEVILACNSCHDQLDALSHAQTAHIVRETIQKRVAPV